MLRPAKPSDPEFLARLRQIAPDCCPVTAYGALIPQAALDIPAHGWVNLHFSLLPAWRGAAPVQHAILHGDEITGATTFRHRRRARRGPGLRRGHRADPAVRHGRRPAGAARRSGAELLVATLDGIESGELEAAPAARRRDQPGTEDQAGGRPGALEPARRGGQPAGPGVHPGARRLDALDGARVKLGPFGRRPRQDGHDGTSSARASCGCCGTRVLVGTGTEPVRLGDVQPPRQAPDARRGLGPRPAPGRPRARCSADMGPADQGSADGARLQGSPSKRSADRAGAGRRAAGAGARRAGASARGRTRPGRPPATC